MILSAFWALPCGLPNYFKVCVHCLYFYADLFSAPASLYSIDPGSWPNLANHLDNSLRFISTPVGTDIPIGGILVSVRHQSVMNKSDLAKVRLSEKRIWLRIRNPSSNKRSLSKSSLRCLNLFKQWLCQLSPMRSMFPKPVWPCKWEDSSRIVNNIFGFLNNLQ